MNRRPRTLWVSAAILYAFATHGLVAEEVQTAATRGSGKGIISKALRQLSGHVASESREQAERRQAGPRRITLHTDRTDIGNALRMVAQQGGLNVVIGPDVSGEVSAYLEDVPVETALRAIAVNNGFSFIVEDDVITVSKPPDRGAGDEEAPLLTSRIFTLQWQDAEQVKDALEYALTKHGKIKVLNQNSMPPYGGTKLSELSGDIDASGSSTGRASVSRASVSGQGRGGYGSIDLQKPRNARKLVVTDTPENLLLLADLIADLDRVPLQVLVEVRIVEMTTDLQRQLGIDWDINVLANGPLLNHELPLNWRGGFSGGSQIRHSPDGTVQTSTALALGTVDFSTFTALFRAHQTDNAIRLLANPRMLIFNNHSASILVGERYPILEANITDFGTLTESFDTYIPVGIQLEVTPSIMADGRISALVHTVTSALGDPVVGTTGIQVNRILTREIDTRIIMRDGRTVVLGGLISDRKTREVNKVPGLGDWPIFSLFFRQESPRSERIDLLIFITAHVEQATVLTERDKEIFETYQPHFKQIERLQDVPMHFEIPTEYEPPRPMFGDPPVAEFDEDEDEAPDDDVLAERQAGPDAQGSAAVTSGSVPKESSVVTAEAPATPGPMASREVLPQADGPRRTNVFETRPRFKTAAAKRRDRKHWVLRRTKALQVLAEANAEEHP